MDALEPINESSTTVVQEESASQRSNISRLEKLGFSGKKLLENSAAKQKSDATGKGGNRPNYMIR